RAQVQDPPRRLVLRERELQAFAPEPALIDQRHHAILRRILRGPANLLRLARGLNLDRLATTVHPSLPLNGQNCPSRPEWTRVPKWAASPPSANRTTASLLTPSEGTTIS